MKTSNTLYLHNPFLIRYWQLLLKTLALLTFLLSSACSTTASHSINLAVGQLEFRPTKGLSNQQTLKPRSNDSELTANTVFNQPLSYGDKVEITIPEGDELNGVYTIELDGTLRLPYLPSIKAVGVSTNQLAKRIRESLIVESLFRADFAQVSVNTVQWAPIHVAMSGAIYNPGNILVNKRNHQESFNPVTSRTGDFADKRLLSSALKAAGGLKPTADIQHIELIRNGEVSVFDMSGLLSGMPVINPVLAAGDQVIVPSVSYLQEALLRPSIVTPPGFRVFLSNLTIPADSNNKASNNKFASSLPPGSRLLVGAMSANCVGGTSGVNAKRHLLLAGKDPLTNKVRVVRRSLEALLAAPNINSVNPYLMPGDSIACYDSGMTNARDIARSISDFLRPFALLSGGVL